MEMDSENFIKDMKPGSTMDLAIAERFGWTAWTEQRGKYTYVVFQRPGEKEPYMSVQKWKEAMVRYQKISFREIDPFKHVVCGATSFTTTWEGMKLVVERIQQIEELNGRSVRLMVKINIIKMRYTVAIIDYLNNEECLAEVMGDQAPEAVGKAFLLALNIKE